VSPPATGASSADALLSVVLKDALNPLARAGPAGWLVVSDDRQDHELQVDALGVAVIDLPLWA
jgi:hypothetical protein